MEDLEQARDSVERRREKKKKGEFSREGQRGQGTVQVITETVDQG